MTVAPEHGPRWLEYLPLDDLRPDPRNPKNHRLDTLRESVGRWGYSEPVQVDERTGLIVSGHGRRELLLDDRAAGRAAPEGVVVDGAGGWLVPVVRGWSSTDDDEAFGYLVAANRIGEQGGWLTERLLAGLEPLAAKGPDMLAGVGYTPDDLSGLLALLQSEQEPSAPAGGSDPDEVPEPPPEPVSRRGDLWLLGPHHRVLCGDCRDPGDVDRLLASAAVNLAFTSPPYADRRVYDESSGFLPIPPEEYVAWFAPVAANVAAHLVIDGSWFVNIKPSVTPDGLDTELYVLDLVIAHAREWDWHFATEFCWQRNGVPKNVTRRFKNQFEPVYQFTRGDWKMRAEAVQHKSANVPVAGGPGVGQTTRAGAQGGNGPMFGAAKRRKHGTTQLMSDVQGVAAAPGEFIGPGMAYPGNRLPTFTSSHEATGHTAAFPVGLPEWFVRAYTDPGDTVLDPFMGSGSTLIAAHRQGRIGYGLEISPRYTDVILARFQRLTGIVPVLESTGEPHDFCAEPAVAEPAG